MVYIGANRRSNGNASRQASYFLSDLTLPSRLLTRAVIGAFGRWGRCLRELGGQTRPPGKFGFARRLSECNFEEFHRQTELINPPLPRDPCIAFLYLHGSRRLAVGNPRVLLLPGFRKSLKARLGDRRHIGEDDHCSDHLLYRLHGIGSMSDIKSSGALSSKRCSILRSSSTFALILLPGGCDL